MLFATAFATHEPLQTVAPDCSAAQCPLPQEDTISCINIEADTIIFNGADWSPLFRTIEQIQDTAQRELKIVSIYRQASSPKPCAYLCRRHGEMQAAALSLH